MAGDGQPGNNWHNRMEKFTHVHVRTLEPSHLIKVKLVISMVSDFTSGSPLAHSIVHTARMSGAAKRHSAGDRKRNKASSAICVLAIEVQNKLDGSGTLQLYEHSTVELHIHF